MSTFLLVHGAWHGAWCWERVEPLLRAQGHTVLVPDLPSHGEDRTPWWRVTIGSYAARVRDTARTSGSVVAVGHSMGGAVIGRAAAEEPGLFAGLIYLAAFVPLPGETIYGLSQGDSATTLPTATRFGLLRVRIQQDLAAGVFYHLCPPSDARAAAERLVPQPLLPLAQRARSPENVPRAYIECSEDRAVSPIFQRRMHERAGMSHVATLRADHSPFYSAPEELVASVIELAARLDGPPARS